MSISYDEFEQMVREEMRELPAYVRKELNGGVLVDPSAYLHPRRLADDLYILGTYSVQPVFGRQIILYYGSFMASMGNDTPERIRTQVRNTLRHEFLHHMESKAGLNGDGTLVEEDRDRMMIYYSRHRNRIG